MIIIAIIITAVITLHFLWIVEGRSNAFVLYKQGCNDRAAHYLLVYLIREKLMLIIAYLKCNIIRFADDKAVVSSIQKKSLQQLMDNLNRVT